MKDSLNSRLRTIHLIGATILIGGLGATAALGVYPMVKSGKASIQKAEELRTRLAEFDGLSKTLDQVDTDRKNTEARLAAAEKLLPTGNEMDKFLGELAKVAEDSGITVEGITPRTTLSAGDYKILPVEINGQGSFPACYKFLAGVRKMPRLTRLDDLFVEAETKPGDDANVCKSA